jgi:hypothetical protein
LQTIRCGQLINKFGELFCFRIDRFIARSITEAFTQRGQ